MLNQYHHSSQAGTARAHQSHLNLPPASPPIPQTTAASVAPMESVNLADDDDDSNTTTSAAAAAATQRYRSLTLRTRQCQTTANDDRHVDIWIYRQIIQLMRSVVVVSSPLIVHSLIKYSHPKSITFYLKNVNKAPLVYTTLSYRHPHIGERATATTTQSNNNLGVNHFIYTFYSIN